MHLEKRYRQKIFYAVVLLASPIWIVMFIFMTCYDIADNFRGQMNKGYNKLMKGGEPT